MSVNSERLGPIPIGLATAHPDAVEGLERYAQRLATDGVVRGLIGPREVPRIWDRHIANCAVIESLIPASATVIDVGSGAGLPGLVLALVRPDISVSLIEPLLRRTVFLNECVEEWGLAARVRVLRGRADEFHRRESAAVVTSRAVASLDQLLTWSWPLVAAGGRVVAIKGQSAAAEISEAEGALKRLGIERSQVYIRDCSSSAGAGLAVVIERPPTAG